MNWMDIHDFWYFFGVYCAYFFFIKQKIILWITKCVKNEPFCEEIVNIRDL